MPVFTLIRGYTGVTEEAGEPEGHSFLLRGFWRPHTSRVWIVAHESLGPLELKSSSIGKKSMNRVQASFHSRVKTKNRVQGMYVTSYDGPDSGLRDFHYLCDCVEPWDTDVHGPFAFSAVLSLMFLFGNQKAVSLRELPLLQQRLDVSGAYFAPAVKPCASSIPACFYLDPRVRE